MYELDYGPEIRTLAERYAREVLGWGFVEAQGPYDLPGDVGAVVLIREVVSMTEEKRVNELLVQCVRNARVILGALRAFVPDDLLPLVNRFLVYTGSVELRATGDCSNEGSGWEKELAMKTICQLIDALPREGR
jgi:hypothetical protein